MKFTKKTAKGIGEVLERWAQVSVPVSVDGTDVEVSPEYFSVLLKSGSEQEVSHIDEARVNPPETAKDSCMNATAHMGRDKQGSGVAQGGMAGLSDDISLLKSGFDSFMDGMVKQGAVRYIQGVAERILTTKPSLLKPRDVYDTVAYRQPPVNGNSTLKFFESEVLRGVKELKSAKGIRRVASEVQVTREHSLFLDTEGSEIFQNKELISLSYGLYGERLNGKDFKTGSSLYFTRKSNYEQRKLERRVEQMIHDAEARRGAIRINTGAYPVLLDGAATATFFHEALAAHLLSGKYIAEGHSTVFSGRIGDQILPEGITVTDDPTVKEGLGSYAYDEEGVKGQKVILVEDGILKNYLLDKTSAAMLSTMFDEQFYSNGKARSQWAIAVGEDGEQRVVSPEPRVTNLLVECEGLLEEGLLYEGLKQVIKDTPNTNYGLFVEGGGGQVYIADGQFTIFPERVWRVDDKGNKEMVEGVKLIGNPDEFFGLVLAAGHPYRSFYGICGSSSGGVPTQHRGPAFLLERVTAITGVEESLTSRLLPRL
jgi:predicted Zn-dependent protease